MNKKPVSYLQIDARWKNKPYRVPGESSTIGSAGCGPTAAAMLIETLTGKKFTPEDACKWSLDHGYKALNQGTYYAYFEPQFKAFGIECRMLNWEKTYGKPDHPNHKKVEELLKQGYYAIALMNKGLWTNSGHFVVLWWQDGKVRINDPASTKDARVNGDIRTFRSQAKYYWVIDARKYNQNGNAEQEKPGGEPGELAVGAVVEFTGAKHYVSSNSTNGKACKPGKAKVTAIAKGGKHPVHLVAVSGGGSNVYGWVDAADVRGSRKLEKGARVRVAPGAKSYTGGGLASWVYRNTYTVMQVAGDRAVIGQDGKVTAAVKTKDLTVVD